MAFLGASNAVGLDSVTRRYGDVCALAGVSLDLRPGVTALLGRNGAGKSTLCRIIAGVEAADSGSLTRDGLPVVGRKAMRSHHRATGWLPQSFSAPAGMTVRQYVGYAAWLKEVPRSRIAGAVADALECADLQQLGTRRLRQLSGGMLRRVGIAQAIVHDPAFLVLDEPSVGLDPEQRSHFHQIVGDLARDRVVLISTHLLEDVEALARDVVVIDAGSVLFSDTVQMLARRAPAPHCLDDDASDPLREGFLALVRES
jgi:ABC-type multidrug transport system ATPase subunit